MKWLQIKFGYILFPAIICAVAFFYYYFNTPTYVGNWENSGEELKLVILKNNVVIYKWTGLYARDSYGHWSEIGKNKIVVNYNLSGNDQVATFRSDSGKVGYFDNGFRTIVFVHIEE